MKVIENPDKALVQSVKEGLAHKGGFCPCKVGASPENKCICWEFRQQIADPTFEGFCHCGLYYKMK